MVATNFSLCFLKSRRLKPAATDLIDCPTRVVIMNQSKIILQPAFVLHTRNYKDTSLLVELFTLDHGRLSILARGIRNARSKTYGLCKPFLPLLVSFGGKTDLPILQKIESTSLSYDLNGSVLLSSFYLNELLMRLLNHHQPYPDIYNIYQQTLSNLASHSHLETTLRLFEKYLLKALGFGLQLDVTVNDESILPEQEYKFEFGSGLMLAKFSGESNLDPAGWRRGTTRPGDQSPNFLGSSLLALHNNNLTTVRELKDAKRLLRAVLANLLGNKPLKSRELFL